MEIEKVDLISNMEVVENIMEVLNYMGFSSIDEMLDDNIPSLRRYLSRLPELYNIEREAATNYFSNRVYDKKLNVIPEIINPILNRKYRGLE